MLYCVYRKPSNALPFSASQFHLIGGDSGSAYTTYLAVVLAGITNGASLFLKSTISFLSQIFLFVLILNYFSDTLI